MLKLFVLLCCFYTAALHAEIKVLAFAGSTRLDSMNQKLVKEAARHAFDMGACVKVLNLKDYPMPLYEGDLEEAEGLPASTRQLKKEMQGAQVIVIASPEYNASYSPLLKNTLDWLSRDEGEDFQTAFKGKTFIIMSASPGQLGGARGLVPLRALLETLGGKVVSGQVSLPNGDRAFDEAGRLKDDQWAQRLRQLIRPVISGV